MGSILRTRIVHASALAGAALLGAVALISPQPASVAAQSTTPASSSVNLDVDAPNAGASVANGQPIVVGGWAVAPGSTQGTGISSVEVYLDSPSGSGNLLGTARLGIARPDVVSVFGQPQWSGSGYNFNWFPTNLSAGPHTLYVVAHSSSGQTSQQAVAITGCGCSSFVGSVTNPGVVKYGTDGFYLDTGGPGVFYERPFDSPRQ